MPDTSNTIVMQVFLLCLMMSGLICAKVRLIDDSTRASLSDLILCVFLPCNILSSFFISNRSELPSLGIIFLISAGLLGLCFVLAKFVLFFFFFSLLIKVLLYATIISNASFIGNPVIESIYGIEALIYSAVYLIPLRLALWTLGIALFSKEKINKVKLIFHPCLAATYLGFTIMLTNFTPPALVNRLAFGLGNCTTPLSMMVVGSVLAMVKPKDFFSRLTSYFTVIRLVLIPLLVFGVCLIIRPEPIVAGVSIVLSGTPAPVTTSILANKYGSDRELASKLVFTSTLFSIVTIPLLIILLKFL
jgi:predicted permease